MGLGLFTCSYCIALVLGVCAFQPKSPNIPPFCTTESSSQSPFELCSTQYSDPAALIIQSLYASLTAADCELANPSNYPPNYSPADGEVFDFIIVGAGSAGAVVANRLTEVYGWKVLLLEAGGNPTKTSEIPALYAFLQQTELDWQYQTDPLEGLCLGMEGNRCNWPRGKALGGTSTINYMFYVRGNAKDYDRWEAEGNTGWSYGDVLPYFKKSEDMRAKEVLAQPDFSQYHSIGGNLKVETRYRGYVKALGYAFAQAMQEVGYQLNLDCNGKTQTGFVPTQGTLEDGRRCSTAKAFLSPITQRNNLKVSKHSLASKILIDEKEKTAYGVEFIKENGTVVRVQARKEIILSAGAINSPQLLMLSGIGPRKELENFNIRVIKDLPVGKNLLDHALLSGLVITLDYCQPTESLQESMFDFLLSNCSSLSGIHMGTYIAFINTIKHFDYPELEYYFMDFPPNNTVNLQLFLHLFNYKDEIKYQFLEINSNSYTVLIFSSLLRPYSSGRIQLKSRNPKQHPKIISGYFSDQRDVDTLLTTYDFVSRLVKTKGLQRLNAKLHEIKVPGCNMFAFGSRKYRECSLRYLGTTTYHPSSTCKMGPATSPSSVVDPYLRVKGVNRLRVIDSSIIPGPISGNLNAPTIMIGEKGSDMIKETWLPGYSPEY